MTGLMVHFDLSGSTDAGSGFKNSDGNYKHKRFLKSRRFLERKGYLNNKQNKTQQKPKSCPNGKIQHQQNHKGPKPLRSSSKRAAEARKPARAKLPPPIAGASCSHTKKPKGAAVKASVPHSGSPSKYLAIDCEMVGTGPNGNNSELARCSIVSYDGDVIYDKFIKPVHKVTDLRTRWSGIRWQHLRRATPFLEAKKEILKILSGKVVVGHALHNDLKALKYSHPAGLTRDTSRIPLLNKKAGIPVKDVASLKRLTKAILNRDIQNGHNGHSSVEDAQATMDLFKTVAVEWEKKLADKSSD